MPTHLILATSQSPTLPTLSATLTALKSTAHLAATKGVSLLLFPEAYLGGYPRTATFGAAVGSRAPFGREQYRAYHSQSVDLGDSHTGEGDRWLQRELPVNPTTGIRGDGTREFLETVARETGVFIVTGLVERAAGSLFCAALYIDPTLGVLGKRRKLMPTGSERLVWSQGLASSLKAVTATIRGVRVTMGCAICWENMMPLLRYAFYAQGVNLWLAPTADGREGWGCLVRTIAMEGRCVVLSANQCVRRGELPGWVRGEGEGGSEGKEMGAGGGGDGTAVNRRKSVTTREKNEIALPASSMDLGKKEQMQAQVNGNNNGDSSAIDSSRQEDPDEYVSRGGSCIVGPLGNYIREPVWENSDELIIAEVDFDDCARGKLDFDAAGHYSRSDQFHFSVEGLDLLPPA